MPTEEYAFLTVTELAKRIESKKLSPVELTQYFLDRSQKFGPRYGAYALLTPEIALAQAKTAEKEIRSGHYRGPLHGIPYAAKDLLAVKGVPCTWGAKPYATQVVSYDATVIEHLNREVLDLRFIFRVRSHRRCGTCAIRHWHGNVGLDSLPFRILRRQRTAPYLRASQPLRRDGACSEHGQDRTARAHSGRLRACVCRDCWSRSARSQHASFGQSGVHLFGFTRIEINRER